jgi:hypothetical protein
VRVSLPNGSEMLQCSGRLWVWVGEIVGLSGEIVGLGGVDDIETDLG